MEKGGLGEGGKDEGRKMRNLLRRDAKKEKKTVYGDKSSLHRVALTLTLASIMCIRCFYR